VDFVYHPTIDPNNWGYRIEHPALDDAVRDYLDVFVIDRHLRAGIVHRVWIYLLLAAGAAWLLLRRRTPLAVAVGLFAASAWTLQVGLFFGATTNTYRYELPAVVAGLAAAAIAMRIALVARNAESGVDRSLPSPSRVMAER
jgi:ribose/xylose/arabinose/galactoside ABC-type transport system permease subunit